MEQKERQYSLDIIAAMAERTIRRLWVLVILLAVLLVGTNIAWIVYEAQFEDVVSTEIEQDTGDGGGTNYIVGGDFNGPPAS